MNFIFSGVAGWLLLVGLDVSEAELLAVMRKATKKKLFSLQFKAKLRAML